MSIGKNRNREPFSFANINLLGKCNADCFFCLGKDIEEELAGQNQLDLAWGQWPNFTEFLDRCRQYQIKKLYITGQNTDSLLYAYLDTLVPHLQRSGFSVGLRTNGYLAMQNLDTMNLCDLSVGLSLHTLNPITNKMMLGRSDLPDWALILPAVKHPRVSIVLTRCNAGELLGLLRYLSRFRHIRYVQIRRVSTERRLMDMQADIAAYETAYTMIHNSFPLKERLWEDAEVYEIFGQDVVFWRTVSTSVNSINYFTDGTISDEYFIVEGYLKHHQDRKKP